jgi:hypothetical protein
VTVACADWKEAVVAPLTLEVPVVVRPKLHLAEGQGVLSTHGKVETSIRFLNNSGQPIKIYWLDYEGNRQLRATVADGGAHGWQRTFLTHPWLITDLDDNAWSIYYPDAQPRTVEVFGSLAAPAPKDGAVGPGPEAASLLGTWKATDRHLAMGSLYQPVHGVRQRVATVHFRQDGDRLLGHSMTEDHQGISFQERWKDGRTEFRQVRFTDRRVAFELDIAEWRAGAGPIAVEDRRLANQGMIRVEARLEGDRLIGQWGMFTADGTEVFRGEWDAVRVAAPGKD